eukprot:scaffold7351_cov259-Pinguiococcus_pyrenoidosus.AAC.13
MPQAHGQKADATSSLFRACCFTFGANSVGRAGGSVAGGALPGIRMSCEASERLFSHTSKARSTRTSLRGRPLQQLATASRRRTPLVCRDRHVLLPDIALDFLGLTDVLSSSVERHLGLEVDRGSGLQRAVKLAVVQEAAPAQEQAEGLVESFVAGIASRFRRRRRSTPRSEASAANKRRSPRLFARASRHRLRGPWPASGALGRRRRVVLQDRPCACPSRPPRPPRLRSTWHLPATRARCPAPFGAQRSHTPLTPHPPCHRPRNTARTATPPCSRSGNSSAWRSTRCCAPAAPPLGESERSRTSAWCHHWPERRIEAVHPACRGRRRRFAPRRTACSTIRTGAGSVGGAATSVRPLVRASRCL